MIKKASFKFLHNRRNKLLADGTANVSMRVTINRSIRYYKTLVTIEPKYWNSETQKVVKHDNRLRLNRVLEDFLREFQDFELRLVEQKEQITFDLIDSFRVSGKYNKSFNAFCMKEYNEATFSKGTKAKHKLVMNRLDSFNSSILFSEINYNFFHEFEKYLRTFTTIKGLPISDNTVRGLLKILRRYVNLAYRLDLIKKVPEYKLPKESFTREGLTEEELKKIIEVEISEFEPNYEKVRDMFVFSCYTALRFSDISALTKADLQITEEGVYLCKKVEKLASYGRSTDIPLFMIFSGKPEKLLKKYLDKVKNDDDLIFNAISNQKTNQHLKRLADATGIKRMKLSFHISRHTCLSIVGEHTGNDYLVMVLGEITNHATAARYTRRAKNSKLYELIAGL